MLKMTGVKLEEISNICLYLFIEKGLRGGIFCIVETYSKANNKYTKNYNPAKPSKKLYISRWNQYIWLGNE